MVQEVLEESLAQSPQRQVEATVQPFQQVWGDPALLRQVFVNLLSNALKYTRNRAHARIEVGGSSDAKEDTFWVKDNGVGFQPESVGKLFRVFQRLHSDTEFEGTGVGLALVQRIVERHGGRVWAEGAPGQGATFFFTLPRREGEPPARA
jgi:signal transduction histidine kinase